MVKKVSKWKAGSAKKIGAAVCTAALGFALVLSAGASSAHDAKGQKTRIAFGVAGAAVKGDAQALGYPDVLATKMSHSKKDSDAWRRAALGVPGAERATMVAYVGIKAVGQGRESGAARWFEGACRVVMPTREASLPSLARMAGVDVTRARALRLADLELFHELGHCLTLDGSATFDLPGLSREDSNALAERVFAPAWSALDQAGYPARLWGENFADAFMSIESLAKPEGRELALEALLLISRARRADAAGVDGSGHESSNSIDLALSEATRWASMQPRERVEAAARIASISVAQRLGSMDAGARARLVSELGDEGVAQAVAEDSAGRWIAAHGQDATFDEYDWQLAGSAPSSLKGAHALARLSATAKAALKSAAASEGSFTWLGADSAPLRRVFDTAFTSSEFGAALKSFGQEMGSGAWRQAWSSAMAKGVVAKSVALWRMGMISKDAASVAAPSFDQGPSQGAHSWDKPSRASMESSPALRKSM